METESKVNRKDASDKQRNKDCVSNEEYKSLYLTERNGWLS